MNETEKLLTQDKSYAFPTLPRKTFPNSLHEHSKDLTEIQIQTGIKTSTSQTEQIRNSLKASSPPKLMIEAQKYEKKNAFRKRITGTETDPKRKNEEMNARATAIRDDPQKNNAEDISLTLM